MEFRQLLLPRTALQIFTMSENTKESDKRKGYEVHYGTYSVTLFLIGQLINCSGADRAE